MQPGEGNLGSQYRIQRAAIPESVIKWRLDTSDVVKDLKLVLSVIGNQKLIDRTVAILTAIVNKSTIQGNLQDEERAAELTLQIADDETNFIGQHYKEYGVLPSNRDLYIDIISTYVFMGLTRPIQDWERKHTVDQGKESVTTHQGIQSYLPLYPGAGGGPPPQQRVGPL